MSFVSHPVHGSISECLLQLEVFVYGGIHSATPDRVLNDGWILDTTCYEWKHVQFKTQSEEVKSSHWMPVLEWFYGFWMVSARLDHTDTSIDATLIIIIIIIILVIIVIIIIIIIIIVCCGSGAGAGVGNH